MSWYWYRRSKLAFDSLRRTLDPKYLPSNYVSSRIHLKGFCNPSANFSPFFESASRISCSEIYLSSHLPMSWYRRSKLAFDSLRRTLDPKYLPSNYVSSRIHLKGFCNPSANFSPFFESASRISCSEIYLSSHLPMSWYRRSKLAFDSLRRTLDPKYLPSNYVSSRIHLKGFCNPSANFSPFLESASRISSSGIYLSSHSAMSWYQRSKLVFESVRRTLDQKYLPSNFVTSRIHLKGFCNPLTNFSGFSSRQVVGLRSFVRILVLSRKPIILPLLIQQTTRIANNLFLSLAKRCCYVGRYQVRHFKPRRWFQNPRTILPLVLIGSGVLITVYFGNLEKVPYTKRTHLVLLSKSLEKLIGEIVFKQTKEKYNEKILPEIHPESIRVRLIAKEIIDALQRGLSQKRDLEYASMMRWSKEDEIQQSRKKDSSESASSHLEGINWEVIVVNDPSINAFCLPTGKIVVFTGLLEHLRSDAEVATVIGHEVGHVVARHAAEGITKNLGFAIIQLVLSKFVMPDLVNTMSALFLELPLSRKMEIEADYIGLILLASAGYDPRVAPKVCEKLGEDDDDTVLEEYLSTHPSGKKRSKLLAQANVMEEALMIYREVEAGRRGIV